MANDGPVAIKDRFTSLDALALSRELRGYLGARIDKAFDHEGGGWAVTFRNAARGKRELVIVPGRYATLVGESAHTDELSPLSKELRRLLTGARLRGAVEPAGERYLELELIAGADDPPLLLAAELFGSGNLLVAREGKILAVQHARTWAHRAVRIGAPYERPPVRANPLVSTAAEIEAALLASRTDRATTLAARLGLGGPVAEEVLVRASLQGSVSAPAEAASASIAIRAAIDRILEEIGDQPRGYLYRRDDVWLDAEPFPSQRMRSDPTLIEEVRPTFSEAAVVFFESLELGPPAETPRDARLLAELGRQREQQANAILALTVEAERLSADGTALLSEFASAETLIEEAVRLDPAAKEPVEIRLGERTITVWPRRPLRESAQLMFEESKAVRSKLEGARAALAATERRIAEERPAPVPRSARTPAAAEERRTLNWFERYRWFLSSEGVLVIGGRDAASNDLIVRRYLHAADRYVHAEIHGAPSVIVRNPPAGSSPPGEATMQEAGQFGVSFSKAWRAGWASGGAFWVTADQVSKAGASGEFVPRGSWVIHGTKNRMKDLTVEVAIGTQPYEEKELWTVGPLRALAARGSARFVLTPGEERDRPEREIELARDLGLSRSRIQALLPAGGVAVRRA
ncbi:MAG: NFACT family protein [Thermoplasmata archaeon]|nr:NFACT family protein [Thermoplasmata archaeon]